MDPETIAIKRRLPDTREGITRRTVIFSKDGQVKLYLSTGEYEDRRLAEFFIRIDKEGSAMRVYEALAIAISLGLQHGVPLLDYYDKLSFQQMEPAGMTDDDDVPIAKSIVDYVFRKIAILYDLQTGRRKE